MAGSNRAALIEKITEIAHRAAEREGLEVWSLELLGSGAARVLRIYIDKPEGVSLTDCETISHLVGKILDEEDIIPGDSYQLEVSSPGVERKLCRPEHFLRFTGKKARLTLREPVENQRRWDGVLSGFEDGCVVLETGVDKAIRVRMEQIEKANLKFEW